MSIDQNQIQAEIAARESKEEFELWEIARGNSNRIAYQIVFSLLFICALFIHQIPIIEKNFPPLLFFALFFSLAYEVRLLGKRLNALQKLLERKARGQL